MVLPLLLFLLACERDAAKVAASPQSPATEAECSEALTNIDGPCIPDGDDDEIADATPLTEGGGTGVIGPDGDVDWWSFSVARAGWWTIDTTDADDKNFDAEYGFYSPGGALWYTTTEPESWPVWLPDAGTWTVKVADRGGGGDEDFDYSLHLVEGGDGFTTVEPDDDVPNIVIDLGGHVGLLATYSSPDDVDRVGLTIPEQGDMPLQLLVIDKDTAYAAVESADTLYPSLSLQDSAETALLSDQIAVRSYILPGDYTLSIGVGQYGMDGPLSVSASPSYLAEEPDLNDEQAYAEEVTSEFGGRIVTDGDVDWWRLAGDGAPPAQVVCWAAVGSTLDDLTVEMVDSGGTTRCSASWNVACEPQESGYGFGIRLSSSTPGAAAWYVCRAGWTQCAGEGD